MARFTFLIPSGPDELLVPRAMRTGGQVVVTMFGEDVATGRVVGSYPDMSKRGLWVTVDTSKHDPLADQAARNLGLLMTMPWTETQTEMFRREIGRLAQQGRPVEQSFTDEGRPDMAHVLRSLTGTAPGEDNPFRIPGGEPGPEIHGRGRCYTCPTRWDATGIEHVTYMVRMGDDHRNATGHIVHLETIAGATFPPDRAADGNTMFIPDEEHGNGD